jgi:pimeloyl-ACP methyl ester carboxylesterase
VRITWAFVVACGLTVFALADGPKDNLADQVRPIPPPGIPVLESDRKELEAGVAELSKEIDTLRVLFKNKPVLLDFLPDVQIYHKAVLWALRYGEFFNTREIPVAKALLKQGLERAEQLRDGRTPWNTATGLVARGYVSRIDGSVQPYGLVVPASYQPNTPYKHRLDLWFHGRGETLSELNFLDQRQRNPGEFTPPHAFVLHPYGRYCNANKFAGEIDTFEALEHAKKHYPIDENRIAVRGFSMGGAACWQFAVHYPSLWAAAAPGAGFSETPDFLRVFQDEKLQPTWYEQKLWHLYDCTDYAHNLANLPAVAYSGEIDKQKQAADMMVKALKGSNIELVHIIGPRTGHAYHPDAKREISQRIDAIVEVQDARRRIPWDISFTTWTLRYNQAFWVRLDGLEQHWERARVSAELFGSANGPVLTTSNVSALTLEFAPGQCPYKPLERPQVRIDGDGMFGPPMKSDRSWTAHFRKERGRWKLVPSLDDGVLRKRPGLQGPIDDAFMDSFLMVHPTGQPMNQQVGAWVGAEEAHAVEHWRRQFRGDSRVKNDKDITDADIAAHNLILWGDPKSNAILAKILEKLPITWTDEELQVKKRDYPAGHHVPVLIFPNPLNPKRYVVLNSGFTYREYDYLNNARQVPKLPDWAVVDISVPANSRSPGRIADAGFFDEEWKVSTRQ